MKIKEEQTVAFEWWITSIPDKIEKLKNLIPGNISILLDYTTASLDTLELYLISNYSVASMQENKELWDCIASYLGSVYKKHVIDSEWYIELDDKKNIYYNKPMVRVPKKVTFEPFSYVLTLIDRKNGNIVSELIKKHNTYVATGKF